ncbi:MAG: thioredoxin family protein [Maribacter sp.]
MKKKFLILALLTSCLAFSQKWEESYEIAKSKADNSEGALLLVFAGSDWCAPCIKLDRYIFQSSEFIKYAGENLILYKADFTRKKINRLGPEITEFNKSLAEKFNPKGYFPLAILLDGQENVLGSFGYENQPVEDYISYLKSVLK